MTILHRLRAWYARLVPPIPDDAIVGDVPRLSASDCELICTSCAANQFEELRQERLAQGPIDHANADKALATVAKHTVPLTAYQRAKLLRGK